MANTYGGIILVGVADDPGADRLVGADHDVGRRIVDACHDALEPPWEPEVIRVDFGDGKAVFVVRVDPSQAPRPLLHRSRAPIRLQGRNAPADRARLAALFTDAPAAGLSSSWRIQPSQMPTDVNGNAKLDLLLGSGLVLPLGERATHRPLSERSIGRLAAALSGSPLGHQLDQWVAKLNIPGSDPFHREGFNRARRAELRWKAASGDTETPVGATAALELPQPYGPVGSTLTFTVEVALAIRQSLPASSLGTPWRLPPIDLDATIDALISALVDDQVVAALAEIAAIDPVLVPQPVNVNLQTGTEITELLYLDGLRTIVGAGPSRGATLLADPTLDLHHPEERDEQLDAWLLQTALDAGLTGMKQLAPRLRQARRSTRDRQL